MSLTLHFALLLLSFALWLTLHLQLLWYLSLHPPRLQALPALLLPPLAPLFAWSRGAKRRAIAWFLLALLYFALRSLAAR